MTSTSNRPEFGPHHGRLHAHRNCGRTYAYHHDTVFVGKKGGQDGRGNSDPVWTSWNRSGLATCWGAEPVITARCALYPSANIKKQRR